MDYLKHLWMSPMLLQIEMLVSACIYIKINLVSFVHIAPG